MLKPGAPPWFSYFVRLLEGRLGVRQQYRKCGRAEFLCEWAYEVYDQMDHPALFQSPREAFAQGLVQTGEREHRAIAYADEFLMISAPSTRKGTAKVERGRGIKIHGIYYSALPLRSPEIEGTQVEVRYDPQVNVSSRG